MYVLDVEGELHFFIWRFGELKHYRLLSVLKLIPIPYDSVYLRVWVLPRLAAEAMQKALGESAEPRKLAISLKAVEYGGELTQKLLGASKDLEKLYEDYIDLGARKVKDQHIYQKLLDKTAATFKWIEKGKALHTKKIQSTHSNSSRDVQCIELKFLLFINVIYKVNIGTL